MQCRAVQGSVTPAKPIHSQLSIVVKSLLCSARQKELWCNCEETPDLGPLHFANQHLNWTALHHHRKSSLTNICSGRRLHYSLAIFMINVSASSKIYSKWNHCKFLKKPKKNLKSDKTFFNPYWNIQKCLQYYLSLSGIPSLYYVWAAWLKTH